MALDTQTKRKSVMSMGMSFLMHPNVPSGSDLNTQGERKLFIGLSSAILSDAPGGGGGSGAAIYMLLRGVG